MNPIDDNDAMVSKRDKDPHLYRFLLRYTNDDDSGKMHDVYAMIDQYRTLSGMTWRKFIYTAIAEFVKEENPQLAEEIMASLQSLRKAGRPKGSSVKQKLLRLGITPDMIDAGKE